MNGKHVSRVTTDLIHAALIAIVGCASGGCRRADSDRVQGYVEGDFIYVAPPAAGKLESLAVARGTWVKKGDPLFALDNTPQKAARDQAQRMFSQAKANWEDATKGKRPSEIESLTAQIAQARAAMSFSQGDLARHEKMISSKATSIEDLDRARSAAKQDRERVTQLEADLKTAQLGMRSDQIQAAEENVRASEAALAKADWDMAEMRQAAPQAGLVFDTLFREGEWVAAGHPVIALLPPPNVFVRAFVPEGRIGSLQVGDPVRVVVDGVAEPIAGKLRFISPNAEYTPPVIYSQENRSKLVFLIEVAFAPATAAKLHPGQPVDVQFGP